MWMSHEHFILYMSKIVFLTSHFLQNLFPCKFLYFNKWHQHCPKSQHFSPVYHSDPRNECNNLPSDHYASTLTSLYYLLKRASRKIFSKHKPSVSHWHLKDSGSPLCPNKKCKAEKLKNQQLFLSPSGKWLPQNQTGGFRKSQFICVETSGSLGRKT